jgi:antitoxin (DNA-binding transcriptional repressor) of toxin-antitoxin stability system
VPDDPAASLPAISLRQLAKHASEVIAELETTGGSLLITRDGEPVARIEPLRRDGSEDPGGRGAA